MVPWKVQKQMKPLNAQMNKAWAHHVFLLQWPCQQQPICSDCYAFCFLFYEMFPCLQCHILQWLLFTGNEVPNITMCFTADALGKLVIKNNGFVFANEGSESSPKEGFIALMHGSELHLKISTTRSVEKNSSIAISISHLSSYQHMGIANIRYGLCDTLL